MNFSIFLTIAVLSWPTVFQKTSGNEGCFGRMEGTEVSPSASYHGNFRTLWGEMLAVAGGIVEENIRAYLESKLNNLIQEHVYFLR